MGTSNPEPQDEMQSGSFISHLVELRDRLLRSVIAIAIGFAVLFPFANNLYSFLAGPLMKHLPEGSSMIAIDVASPFLAPFKLVLLLSVVITIPYTLHQFWAFVAPGLYKHEKRLAAPLLISSVVLFYLGMAFAYYVVFPLVFGFFTSVAPEGVSVMTDINRYLDFVLMLFLAFGIAFEVPVATILIVMVGITTPAKLARMRPYIIVAAFVIGMLLTPPDVISQILLAIPMWLLFEAGLWMARLLVPAKEAGDQDGDNTATSPTEEAINQAIIDEEPYRHLSDEEMEAELDRLEEDEEEESGPSHDTPPNSGGDPKQPS